MLLITIFSVCEVAVKGVSKLEVTYAGGHGRVVDSIGHMHDDAL